MTKRRNRSAQGADASASKQLRLDAGSQDTADANHGQESPVKPVVTTPPASKSPVKPAPAVTSPQANKAPERMMLSFNDYDPLKIGCDSEAQLRAAHLAKLKSSGAENPAGENGHSVGASNEVTEGKASVLIPPCVFYLKTQENEHDLTVAVVAQYSREVAESKGVTLSEAGVKPENGGIKIFEALGGSGLKSVRFALEVPGVKEIVCNDFDLSAVDFIKQNIEKNNVGNLVRANKDDCMLLMQACRSSDSKYDVIDLDPCGSPSHFLDGAVQAIKNGGLLCVTATDIMQMMNEHVGEACYTKYGSYGVMSRARHEMALRILLHSIEQHATRYSKYIVPVLSFCVGIHVRVFVRVYESATMARYSASKQGMIYQCVGCGSLAVQPLGRVTEEDGHVKHQPAFGVPVGRRCEHCGERHKVAGPMWIGRLHDKAFVKKVSASLEDKNKKDFSSYRRLMGTLKGIQLELEDVVLYHVLDELCKTLHCTLMPAAKFKAALLNAGYQVSDAHALRSIGVKTNAPNSVVWDIMRLWVAQNPISSKRLLEGTVARNILEVSPSITVSFERPVDPDASPETLEYEKSKAEFQAAMKLKKEKQKKSIACLKFFTSNKQCAEADECPYSHDPEVYNEHCRTRPCLYHFGPEAKCEDPNCLYSHDPEFLKTYAPTTKRFPCRAYLKGKCPLAEIVCKNHHQGTHILRMPKEKKPTTPGEDGQTSVDDLIGQAIDQSDAVLD